MSIDLEALYIDLHRHPELSFQETRTAGVITRELTALGLDYVEGLGTTGVATSITGTGAGEGPVVWLRADMDGLPVAEQTGLAYASTARGVDPAGTEVPVMHACGHDMHVTALLGALERLAATREEWSGTVVAVFQPAEEYGAGAQAMIADGVLDRFPKPDIVLGPKAALALTLILHELTTNAVKYGALSNEKGRVSLRWGADEIEGVRQFRLRWQESGGPPVKPPARAGFGSRLIERSFPGARNGTESAYLPGGLVFTLDAPFEALGGTRDETGSS